MDGREFEHTYVRPVVGVMTAYEAVAIFTGKVPTLSSIVWWLYKRRWGQVALWGLWGWATAHFFTRVAEDAMQKEHRNLLRLLVRERDGAGYKRRYTDN